MKNEIKKLKNWKEGKVEILDRSFKGWDQGGYF